MATDGVLLKGVQFQNDSLWLLSHQIDIINHNSLLAKMSTVNKVNPLQGYRIAFLRNTTNVDNLRSVREAGADTVTFPHDGPSSGYDPDIFLNWWIRERDRAVEDQVQLVVVKLYSASAYYRLQRVEEDEWYSQGELRTRVRFTTLKKLELAVSCEEPLKDDWGDIIESFDQ